MLIGDPRAYQKAALNTPGNDRKTDLTEKLRQVLKISINKPSFENNQKIESSNHILTPELIYSGQIDPMIGMKGVELKSR